MSYLGIPPARLRDSQNRVEYTAGAGQTSFAVAYAPGYVDVYQNGVKLAGVDFTATDGANVVLATGATLGDIISLVAIKANNPYDNYTKAQSDALMGVFYAVATGTVDALAVTTTPLIPALANGVEVRVRVTGPNTSTVPTITFSNLGLAKNIVTQGNQNLVAGAWATGQEITLRYNAAIDKMEWLGGVGAATSAEVLAGLLANKALTPVSFLAQWTGSNQSKAATGYQKLPGGIILQWSRNTISASSSVAVTFPIAFPTACAMIVLGGNNPNGDGNVSFAAESVSGFTIYNGTAASRTGAWLAIGY